MIKTNPSKYDTNMIALQRRCSVSRAIALFRISDSEFLFCYDSESKLPCLYIAEGVLMLTLCTCFQASPSSPTGTATRSRRE